MNRPAAMLAVVSLAVVGLTACTSAPTPTAEPPARAMQEIECPTDVRDALVVKAICGYVEVPAHRDDTPETLKVFVARIPPGSTTAPSAAPLLVVGTDLGDQRTTRASRPWPNAQVGKSSSSTPGEPGTRSRP